MAQLRTLWTAVCLLFVISSTRSQSAAPAAVPAAATVPPPGTVTVKTILSQMQVGSRAGEAAPAPPLRLTPCAQAILGCCDPQVDNRQYCFEQIGCGPHVFGDPCDKAFLSQALGGAERFYSQFMPNTISGAAQ